MADPTAQWGNRWQQAQDRLRGFSGTDVDVSGGDPVKVMLGMLAQAGWNVGGPIARLLLSRAGALNLLQQADVGDPASQQNYTMMPGSFLADALSNMGKAGGFGSFAQGIVGKLLSNIRGQGQTSDISQFWGQDPEKLAQLLGTTYGQGPFAQYMKNRLAGDVASASTGGQQYMAGGGMKPPPEGYATDWLDYFTKQRGIGTGL